jgi:hypothetical protein
VLEQTIIENRREFEQNITSSEIRICRVEEKKQNQCLAHEELIEENALRTAILVKCPTWKEHVEEGAGSWKDIPHLHCKLSKAV